MPILVGKAYDIIPGLIGFPWLDSEIFTEGKSISKPNAEKFVISASTIFASTKCHSSSVNQMRFGIGRLRFAIKSPSSIGLGFAQNGFQGVPDLHLWDPDAMLANRRSRSGYPCRAQWRRLRRTAKSTAPTSTTGIKSSSKESRSSCFSCCFTGWETISGTVVGCCGASVFLLLKLFAACTVLF